MDERLNLIFLNKPEIAARYPDWMLPDKTVERLRGLQGLAIVEMAGRDSVAAALKAANDYGFTTLLPTYVYTGTEYGPWSAVEEAMARLDKRLPPGTELLPPLVFGSPRFWNALNGSFLTHLGQRLRFTPTCVGCHLYLHSMRIPLAHLLAKPGRSLPIIAGEREMHDGRIKINQVGPALDAYASLARDFKVELFMPLRMMADGQEIEQILGMDWAEGGDQLGCAMSGNYRSLNGEVDYEPTMLKAYFNQFALPLTRLVIGEYLEARTPDYAALAGKILSGEQ